jgi:hypothetical protein
MARPQTYDDTRLLEIIADLLVSGEATSDAEAKRNAAAYISNWESWPEHKQAQLFDRLTKKYSAGRAKFEQDARERIDQRANLTWLPKFLPPSLLDAPCDPALEQQSRDMLELECRLRDISTWTAELADLVKEHWLSGDVNQALVAHARDLVNLVQKEQADMGRKNSPC